MTTTLILQMIVAAVIAAIMYTIIGAAPGADETATIAPITLVLVLSGLHPAVILTFFISAIVACKLIDAVPVSTAGIPAGVMSTPMVEHAMVLKKFGLTDTSIRKIASGAVVGTFVSVPVSLFLARALVPFSTVIKQYGDPVFFIGAVLLALMSKNRWVALASILPFALLIQGLRHLYWGIGAVPKGTNVFTSFFLAITIGPVILTLFELLNKEKRESMKRFDKKSIYLKKAQEIGKFPNPFRILTKKEIVYSTMASLIGSVAFILSPVGLTTFFGELFASRTKDPVEKASLAISTMEALAQATYFSGTLIPLIALGIPLSPMSLGPANPLFNAPPVFTLQHNMHHILSGLDFISATLIGAAIASAFTYFVAVKYSQQICAFVFKKIPHEALLGLFFSLVLLLAFMDAGWINIAGVLLIGIVAGVLYRLGVNYGVLFMILYSAPWIIKTLAG
ncbi:tripartite tricarboxylate transporter permease [Fonticella tunisiensis]|uniref:Tripartite tricarboxylate transporter TctA family protein n=1 Tax=Fonticella tunisiensis TaxID=1096341 RepID=A0A4V3EV95_9CLOT|nr:tripartite tricarboxylate transporter permease [Fonticella tunisiensis]TDT62844.1 tripartite tricarboxylate transporter TctA family protein [Fonticella tunisiensis]